MDNYFSRTIEGSFEHVVGRVTAGLMQKGFGILTTIDVKSTMKTKLGVDFRPYVILGACNPHFAWRALQAEDKIGTMLPCNVVVSEIEPRRVEVAAVDPVASLASIDNPELTNTAHHVRDLLHEVVEHL